MKIKEIAERFGRKYKHRPWRQKGVCHGGIAVGKTVYHWVRTPSGVVWHRSRASYQKLVTKYYPIVYGPVQGFNSPQSDDPGQHYSKKLMEQHPPWGPSLGSDQEDKS